MVSNKGSDCILVRISPFIDYKLVTQIAVETNRKERHFVASKGVYEVYLKMAMDDRNKKPEKRRAMLIERKSFLIELGSEEEKFLFQDFGEDCCFRIACKNEKRIKVFKNLLIKLDLFRRYDGLNLITYNKKYFKSKIFPFLKHPDKVNRCNLLFNEEGYLENRFLNILNLIKYNNNLTYKMLSKNLKRIKVYSQVKFLENLDCVKIYGYPKMIKITNKGLNQLYRGQGH